jgi:CHASE2 domain-containing sensor protein
VIVEIAFLMIAAAAYLAPAIIAAVRKHPNTGAILAVTLLLGWTGIGWIVAFIWSWTNPATPSVVVVSQAPAGTPTQLQISSPTVGPGWYTDPYNSAMLRWWNGSAWTDSVHPQTTSA